MSANSRRMARRFLLQAFYQAQLSEATVAELREQFMAAADFNRADSKYFLKLLEEIAAARDELDAAISHFGEIPAAQLDPVEHAILWVALAELRFHPDVPHRVVINEAIELTKSFGAEGGHRYVNALLDRAASGGGATGMAAL
jgi:N utilization substance protein B